MPTDAERELYDRIVNHELDADEQSALVEQVPHARRLELLCAMVNYFGQYAELAGFGEDLSLSEEAFVTRLDDGKTVEALAAGVQEALAAAAAKVLWLAEHESEWSV